MIKKKPFEQNQPCRNLFSHLTLKSGSVFQMGMFKKPENDGQCTETVVFTVWYQNWKRLIFNCDLEYVTLVSPTSFLFYAFPFPTDFKGFIHKPIPTVSVIFSGRLTPALNMEAPHSFEMLATTDQTTWHHTPDMVLLSIFSSHCNSKDSTLWCIRKSAHGN